MFGRGTSPWRRVRPSPSTGCLAEAVWAKAESIQIAYGVYDGNPGSGWKTTTLGGTPTNGPRATIKFLSNKTTNQIFIAVIAKDSSVGGAGWENADGLLAGIYDRNKKAASQVSLHRDIFISWVRFHNRRGAPQSRRGRPARRRGL